MGRCCVIHHKQYLNRGERSSIFRSLLDVSSSVYLGQLVLCTMARNVRDVSCKHWRTRDYYGIVKDLLEDVRSSMMCIKGGIKL